MKAVREGFGEREFGVSTECGLGRRGKEVLRSVLEIVSKVCRR